MVLPPHHQKAPSNYAEYLAWDDEDRWELIQGIPYNMTPAPSAEHQNVISNLHGEFYHYLKGKACKSFVAPFDVRLFAEDKTDEEIINYVQPDISIICDKNKIDNRGCVGAPDLVVEVLSPSTAKKDRSEKLRLYIAAGVKEYWIIDPFNQALEVYNQEEKQTTNIVARVYSKEDVVKVGIFEDCEIELRSVFDF